MNILLLCLSLFPAQVPAGAPPRYRLVELPVSGVLLGQAFDVNERRAVVGSIDPGATIPLGAHAALWTADGTLIDLTPDTNYYSGNATSINNAGVVAGNVDTRDAQREGAFRWHDGVLEFLPTRYQSDARHVDERGHIGGSAHSAVFQFEPTIWTPDLGYEQFPALGGGDGVVQDINGWGDTVGYDLRTLTGFDWGAFVRRDGVLRELDPLPGQVNAFALATNVQRMTVGWSGPVLAERAVRWHPDGTIETLPRLGTGSSLAASINDHGEIVGYSTGPQGRFAALWLDGAGYSLESLVDDLAGRRLLGAENINERGDIVGYFSPAGGGYTRPFLALRADGGHPAVIGPTPAVSGGTSAFELVGLTPGAVVALCLGLRHGKTPLASCPGMEIEIKNPRVIHGVADPAGNVRFDVPLPARVRGKHVLAQALELGSCRRTSLAVTRLD
jgi:uncharacterized membrane protein